MWFINYIANYMFWKNIGDAPLLCPSNFREHDYDPQSMKMSDGHAAMPIQPPHLNQCQLAGTFISWVQKLLWMYFSSIMCATWNGNGSDVLGGAKFDICEKCISQGHKYPLIAPMSLWNHCLVLHPSSGRSVLLRCSPTSFALFAVLKLCTKRVRKASQAGLQ